MKKIPLWESSPPLRLVVFNRQPARASSTNGVIYGAHSHSFFELGMVLAGECTWQLSRRRRLALRSGQAILVNPGSMHNEEIPLLHATELAWLGFDFAGPAPAWAEQIVSLCDVLAEVSLCFHAIYREHSAPDPITRRRVALALQNVLVLVSRCAESGPLKRTSSRRSLPKSDLNARQTRSIEAAAHYFRHNCRQSLSIAQVAAYHSFCPAHFSTLFRRHYRMAPRTFLQKMKIEKAAELLTTSDLSIKEIGHTCGFVDASHLSKAFKRTHRLTPGAFRMKVR